MVKSVHTLEEEYRSLTPKSRAQWERGTSSMPGGVMRQANWKSPHPIYVERAEGCFLWDLDGRRYVDFTNHASAVILGHNPPEVVEAVQRELERGIALSGPTTLDADMAEEIVKRFPSMDKVRFTNSGTEASLHATRLVRAATGKPKIAKFEGAYHGSHDALEVSVSPSLDRAGAPDSPEPVAEWDGLARGAEEDVVVLPYNQPESVELILREHQSELAGVFYDGKPGLLEIPVEFSRFVRDITSELGIPLVVDEVISFRAGYGGYQSIAGIKPDVTIIGKIVGGGFPVGAIGGSSELMDLLDNSESPTGPRVSGTFSGNNFTLAAGLATLRALTPEVYEHLDGLRLRLHDGLEEVLGRAGIPCRVVSGGSIVNPYLTDSPVRDYRGEAAADKSLWDKITLGLAVKGYEARGGMGLILSAPMGNEEIDGLLQALDEVLSEEDD